MIVSSLLQVCQNHLKWHSLFSYSNSIVAAIHFSNICGPNSNLSCHSTQLSLACTSLLHVQVLAFLLPAPRNKADPILLSKNAHLLEMALKGRKTLH